MKVLLDHNVPKRLRDILAGHEVSTAREMAWAELENGSLLREAEQAGFALMITCDQKLAYQQNLSGRKIALLIFNTNNWQILQRNTRLIASTIDSVEPGSFRFLEVKSHGLLLTLANKPILSFRVLIDVSIQVASLLRQPLHSFHMLLANRVIRVCISLWTTPPKANEIRPKLKEPNPRRAAPVSVALHERFDADSLARAAALDLNHEHL